MGTQDEYEARTIAAHSGEFDDAIAEDEAIDAVAAEIWQREIGSPMSAVRLVDAIGEVISAYDEEGTALLGIAASVGEKCFGRILLGQVRDYLEAQCRIKARAQIDALMRQSEDEAAAARMES